VVCCNCFYFIFSCSLLFRNSNCSKIYVKF